MSAKKPAVKQPLAVEPDLRPFAALLLSMAEDAATDVDDQSARPPEPPAAGEAETAALPGKQRRRRSERG